MGIKINGYGYINFWRSPFHNYVKGMLHGLESQGHSSDILWVRGMREALLFFRGHIIRQATYLWDTCHKTGGQDAVSPTPHILVG